MNKRLRYVARYGLVIAISALAAPGPVASPRPMTKEQMHEQMVDIAARLAELKAAGQAGEQSARLEARYRELSDALGGDDPGRVLGSAGAGDGAPPQRAGGVAAAYPVPPPGCTMTGHTPWVSVTPYPINDFQLIASTILVSGAGSALWEIDLVTAIQHTFPGDLVIALTSPEGTEVTVTMPGTRTPRGP
jgi:hypothetical protein